ncbi:protein of unknown function (plasmid) [Cupriavidus taiwanensis]|uniref:Uncharacterized protein n=1 Tax=Cupriavidus taiwanensis TaxID=164546 RepID=A0A7Z7NNR2_9BURK|nr:protein of unknown function [Cupriavidus taiwanensis]SOZ11880.1 protein of unknown function [Cupriavidus taiwanensis]SOZ43235.1 protein of unknown function [Cupriavidus taiwanensis]SPC22481.1 protein of unknown function [Cupriavidus taiwanensis]SPD53990.1 protein of unknown function [Cupriavidus taiwanensis]
MPAPSPLTSILRQKTKGGFHAAIPGFPRRQAMLRRLVACAGLPRPADPLRPVHGVTPPTAASLPTPPARRLIQAGSAAAQGVRR